MPRRRFPLRLPEGWVKWLEATSYVAGVVALFLLWVQLRDDAQARQAQHSLEFVAQFNSDPMNRFRQTALAPWLPLQGYIRRLNEGKQLPRSEIDDWARGITRNYDAAHPEAPLSLAVQEIAGFFDQMKVCIDTKVCSEKILRAYFVDYATNFWCVNQTIVRDARGSLASSSFGGGLEMLRDKQKCR